MLPSTKHKNACCASFLPTATYIRSEPNTPAGIVQFLTEKNPHLEQII